MPLRAHVHLICVANCFTILHPLHPFSSIVCLRNLPKLDANYVFCMWDVIFSIYWVFIFVLRRLFYYQPHGLKTIVSYFNILSYFTETNPIVYRQGFGGCGLGKCSWFATYARWEREGLQKSTTYGLQIPSWKKQIPKLQKSDMQKNGFTCQTHMRRATHIISYLWLLTC